MKAYSPSLLTALIMALVLLLPAPGHAGLAEPGNVIHGPVAAGVEQVSLRVNGVELAAWQRSLDPDSADAYVLRIPMDSLEPREPDTARPGEEAEIFLDDAASPVKWVSMGQRGTLLYLRLDETDSDGDGLSDREENELGSNPYSDDSDGDGVIDRYDPDPANPDSDGDGYLDGYELAVGTDPEDPNDIPVIYVDQANDSGVEDGSAAHPFNTVREGLQAAPDKYTVLVAPGVYQETLTISKEVRLQGASPLTTIIDAQGTAVALFFNGVDGAWSSVERLTLRNAVNGINCNSASPLIRNVALTGFSSGGVLFGSSSTGLLVNATISGNPDATAVFTESAGVRLVNNIISHNRQGIHCIGGEPRLAYNLLYDNSGGDYDGCGPGLGDSAAEPLFAASSRNDFRLRPDSAGIDAGDPREQLFLDYIDGVELVVYNVSDIEAGDRVWITDGANEETAISLALTPTTLELDRPLLHVYLVADNAEIYTLSSDSSLEPEESRSRIDAGAFGNSAHAGPGLTPGDFNGDGLIDLVDLMLVLQRLTEGTSVNMHADVGGNGIIDLVDALFVMEATVGRR